MPPNELVKVARAMNESEAELIQGLLREEGIPSIVYRAPGVDVPDMMAAGARDVLVPPDRQDEARDVLRAAEAPGLTGTG